MIQTDTIPGRTIRIDTREFLYFSGTSYLGVTRDKTFRSHLREGIGRYGTHYASSRMANVQLAIFAEAEQYLANYTGAEAALTFSSGFLAGQAVVRQLQSEGTFVYAPGTHPALWLSTAPEETVKDYTSWTEQLLATTQAYPNDRIILLMDSLDPLYAKAHAFNWLNGLSDRKRWIVVVDDSHGLGVTGKDGAGVYSQLQLPPHVELIVTSSLGKALGLPGGVVLGSKQRIAGLKRSPFFTASSPMPPAYLYAFLRFCDGYPTLRRMLFENVALFKKLISGLDLFQSIDSHPVFYTNAAALYPHLYQNQMLIASFAYPSPESPPVTRLVINRLHTRADIARVAAAIRTFAAANR